TDNLFTLPPHSATTSKVHPTDTDNAIDNEESDFQCRAGVKKRKSDDEEDNQKNNSYRRRFLIGLAAMRSWTNPMTSPSGKRTPLHSDTSASLVASRVHFAVNSVSLARAARLKQTKILISDATMCQRHIQLPTVFSNGPYRFTFTFTMQASDLHRVAVVTHLPRREIFFFDSLASSEHDIKMSRDQLQLAKLLVSLAKSLFLEEVAKHYRQAKLEGRDTKYWRLSYAIYCDRWPTDDPGFHHTLDKFKDAVILRAYQYREARGPEQHWERVLNLSYDRLHRKSVVETARTLGFPNFNLLDPSWYENISDEEGVGPSVSKVLDDGEPGAHGHEKREGENGQEEGNDSSDDGDTVVNFFVRPRTPPFDIVDHEPMAIRLKSEHRPSKQRKTKTKTRRRRQC
ncbi:hypothetical protein CVT26_012759, partial [Gymnopilus dilepis]